MTACPRCQSPELRVHGSRTHVDFVKRWRWFGAIVPRVRVRALDVSCGACMYAFVLRHSGVTPAPLQTAHDQLQEAQDRLKLVPQKERPPTRPNDDDEPPTPRSLPARPASDPRVKRR